MPTSFQFGSREVESRANVQTSVMSATLSGLPSTMVPALSRGHRDHLRHEADSELGRAIARLRADDLGLVDRHEPSLGLLLVLLAILDRGLEAFIDLSVDSRSRSARRSPLAKASTIIS